MSIVSQTPPVNKTVSNQKEDYRFVSRSGSVIEYQILQPDSRAKQHILVVGGSAANDWQEFLAPDASIVTSRFVTTTEQQCAALVHSQAKSLDEFVRHLNSSHSINCLLYTSDAADE